MKPSSWATLTLIGYRSQHQQDDSSAAWVQAACQWSYYRLCISRDQPNSQFHNRDIWNWPSSVKNTHFHVSVKFRDFCVNFNVLLSFMKVFRVLSTAFVRILLFATCHTSALSSWHVFTVSLTYIQSRVLTYYINNNNNIRCSKISNVLFDRFVSLH